MDKHFFDGMIDGLIGLGIMIGVIAVLVIAAIGFGIYWLCQHLSLTWS